MQNVWDDTLFFVVVVVFLLQRRRKRERDETLSNKNTGEMSVNKQNQNNVHSRLIRMIAVTMMIRGEKEIWVLSVAGKVRGKKRLMVADFHKRIVKKKKEALGLGLLCLVEREWMRVKEAWDEAMKEPSLLCGKGETERKRESMGCKNRGRDTHARSCKWGVASNENDEHD